MADVEPAQNPGVDVWAWQWRPGGEPRQIHRDGGNFVSHYDGDNFTIEGGCVVVQRDGRAALAVAADSWRWVRLCHGGQDCRRTGYSGFA